MSEKPLINKANGILMSFCKDKHMPKDLEWLYGKLSEIGIEIDTINAVRTELKGCDGYKLFPCTVLVNGIASEKYFATWEVEETDFGNYYIIYIG